MTARQREKIADNLRAFVHNFGEVRIEKEDFGPGFMVYYPANSESWLYFAPNIDNLDGWLYGAVQAVHRIAPAKQRAGIVAEIDNY